MPCRDGTRLMSRIWEPEGAGPWPVLLMRQPYGRAIASTPTLAHPAWWARQGFLVVVQDVRGQGDSEGAFGGFSQEAADSSDCLHWVRQMPGSNGRVGTYGFSYQGFTQLVGLADPENSAPPALPDCLVVAMAGLDERLHWASSGGAHWWALGLAWGLQLAALACRRRGEQQAWQAIRRSLENGSFLQEGPDLLSRHDPGGMAWRWLQSDPANPLDWPQHEAAAGLLQRPLLLVGGWHDPHLEGVLDLWQRSQRAGGAPRLRIGAWTHLNWQEGADALHLAFFRQHLQGGPQDPTLRAPLAVQDPRGGAWLTASPTDTSPAETRPSDAALGAPLRWRLAGDARATAGPGGQLLPATDAGTSDTGDGEAEGDQAGGGTVWLVHDPWRPVPGRGGHLGLDAGVCDRGDLDGRRDVVCFTSAPLERAWQLLGRPRLQLTVQADQPGFDLCAALSVLTAEGGVLQLATGVQRHRGDSCLQAAPREVILQPLLLRLQPGERLRLSLAAAAWPQIAVNPGDGSLPWGGTGPAHRVVTLTLHLAGAVLELEPLTPCPTRNLPANCGDPSRPL